MSSVVFGPQAQYIKIMSVWSWKDGKYHYDELSCVGEEYVTSLPTGHYACLQEFQELFKQFEILKPPPNNFAPEACEAWQAACQDWQASWSSIIEGMSSLCERMKRVQRTSEDTSLSIIDQIDCPLAFPVNYVLKNISGEVMLERLEIPVAERWLGPLGDDDLHKLHSKSTIRDLEGQLGQAIVSRSERLHELAVKDVKRVVAFSSSVARRTLREGRVGPTYSTGAVLENAREGKLTWSFDVAYNGLRITCSEAWNCVSERAVGEYSSRVANLTFDEAGGFADMCIVVEQDDGQMVVDGNMHVEFETAVSADDMALLESLDALDGQPPLNFVLRQLRERQKTDPPLDSDQRKFCAQFDEAVQSEGGIIQFMMRGTRNFKLHFVDVDAETDGELDVLAPDVQLVDLLGEQRRRLGVDDEEIRKSEPYIELRVTLEELPGAETGMTGFPTNSFRGSRSQIFDVNYSACTNILLK